MGNQHSNLLPKSVHDIVDSRTGSIDMLSALLYLRRQKRALQDDLDNALDDAYALASQEYEEEIPTKKRKLIWCCCLIAG